MHLTPTHVTSSNISNVAHEGNRLYIEFHSGVTYAYDDTPHSVFAALAGAESPGQFFHRFIKGKYHYTRLETNPFTS